MSSSSMFSIPSPSTSRSSAFPPPSPSTSPSSEFGRPSPSLSRASNPRTSQTPPAQPVLEPRNTPLSATQRSTSSSLQQVGSSASQSAPKQHAPRKEVGAASEDGRSLAAV